MLREFIRFAAQEKRWWLIPLVLLLLAAGLVLVCGSGAGISWALYPFL